MSYWKILGIEPTRDVREIKRAYAKMTRECHREDDPEGWEVLHRAYLSAVSYAQAGSNYPNNLGEGFSFDNVFSSTEEFEEAEEPETSVTKAQETDYFENRGCFGLFLPVEDWDKEKVNKELKKRLIMYWDKDYAQKLSDYFDSAEIRELYNTAEFWECVRTNCWKTNMYSYKAAMVSKIIRRIYDEYSELMDPKAEEACKATVDYVESVHYRPARQHKFNKNHVILIALFVVLLLIAIIDDRNTNEKKSNPLEDEERIEETSKSVNDLLDDNKSLFTLNFFQTMKKKYPSAGFTSDEFIYTRIEDGTKGYYVRSYNDSDFKAAIVNVTHAERVEDYGYKVLDNRMVDKLTEDVAAFNRDQVSELLGTEEWTLEIVLSEKDKEIDWINSIGTPVYITCSWESLEDFAMAEVDAKRCLINYSIYDKTGSLGKLVYHLPEGRDFSQEELEILEQKLSEWSYFFNYYEIEVDSQ